MARINGSTRRKNRILAGPPKLSRGSRKLGRKLNKLNFLLILGLYALELKLFSQENLEIVKSYVKISIDYLLSLF